MDKLEQMKVDYAENNAITDDMAGHAYIEEFGQETFQRADKAMNANKVTRQTADTFQAAATFLDLGQIWGGLEPEIASKIKYAKYHALRIAKALKAGEDPNLSNPVPEPDPADVAPLDPNDPEVQAINGIDKYQEDTRQPSVEEVPDEHHQVQPSLAQRSTADESLHPSRAPSVPPQQEQHQPLPPDDEGDPYHVHAGAPEVSPLRSSPPDRKLSSGGGYFPTVPDGVGHAPSSLSDTLPVGSGSSHVQNTTGFPPFPPSSSAIASAPSLHSFPPLHVEGAAHVRSPPSIPSSASHPPTQSASGPPIQNFQPQFQGPSPDAMQRPGASPDAAVVQPSAYTARPTAPANQVYETNEEAILKAQKHAKWAISALNFEDVTTAVRELKGALETLGAA